MGIMDIKISVLKYVLIIFCVLVMMGNVIINVLYYVED